MKIDNKSKCLKKLAENLSNTQLYELYTILLEEMNNRKEKGLFRLKRKLLWNKYRN